MPREEPKEIDPRSAELVEGVSTVTANTHTRVLSDETELDYARLVP